MLTDRGPNGQIKVDGTNRRTFWVPEFTPMILRVKTEGKTIRILETIPIVGQSGKPVTGLPNLKDVDETPYEYSAREFYPSTRTVSIPKGSCAPPRATSGSPKSTARRSCTSTAPGKSLNATSPRV